MKLIKQTDLKRRMVVLVSALTAIAAGAKPESTDGQGWTA